MSIKRMSAVWEDSEHKGSALIFMLAIADNADDLGVAWPGYEYLAHKTRMSRRTVMRLATTCAESGEIWMMHRDRQQSNVYIVTVGLSLLELQEAAIKASKMGALPTTGSDILTPPPQVLEVINRPEVVTKCHHVVIPGVPCGDTAMTPEPSVPVINHQGTVIEPPTTTPVVDVEVLAELRTLGINGRKAKELISSYAEDGELPALVPRLSEWLMYLAEQDGVKSPLGLAITKAQERSDIPDGAYLHELAEKKRRKRYTEGKWADIIQT